MNLPETIYAGDHLDFSDTLSDYKASEGWTLHYVIINSTSKYTIDSTADGDAHKFDIASSVTGDWDAGDYTWLAYVTKTGEEDEHLYRGQLTIKENLVTATTYDSRSHAKKSLDAIEAAIERRASKEQMQLQITVRGSSRALQYMSMDELIKARAYYRSLYEQELQQEKINRGESPGNKVLLQFK